MDLSKFKAYDWMMVGGGAVMLVLGFVLPWSSVRIEFFGVVESDSGDNPFDYFLTGGIAWLLVVGIGVIAFLVASGIVSEVAAPWRKICVIAGAAASTLMLLRVLMGPRSASSIAGTDSSFDEELFFEFGSLTLGAGAWVALGAALLTTAGAWFAFSAAGGTFANLVPSGGTATPNDAPPPPPPPPLT